MKTHFYFNTTEYQFAHGKMPRGEGNWAFIVDGEKDPIFLYGTLSSCKKQVKEILVGRGITCCDIVIGS